MVSIELCIELLDDYNDLSLTLNVNCNVSLSYAKESKKKIFGMDSSYLFLALEKRKNRVS